MTSQLDTAKAAPKCARCGQDTKLIYAFLDPRSGKQVRSFQCECGERTMVTPTSLPSRTG